MSRPKMLVLWRGGLIIASVAGLLAFALDPVPAQKPIHPPTPGNRLAYLDQPCDPYYVGRHFPKLTTPQWVGESGVEAVVILAIDDMRDPVKYESYLRPILDRLKEIDGRAPVSIMTNQVDPQDPQVLSWIKEGLSIDVHTIDHPCPCLKDSDFGKSQQTYNDCVDLMFQIPGNQPTAFRMPCCDSLNTPSPRFWSEIFNRTTSQGRFLQADSSVFQIFTPEDPDLPADLLVEDDGQWRFNKYVPFPSFANTIRNYPYPYVIGGVCWEFPCMVPSDWQAQHLHQPHNPQTVEDMKVALDLTVRKQGVMNLVFHPHGWIRNDQMVQLIDHAVEQHGPKVKFLTFREAVERLNKHLLGGIPLRDATTGSESGNRLVDLDGDGYLDVVQRGPFGTRRWDPEQRSWHETQTPFWTGPSDFLREQPPAPQAYSITSGDRLDRFGVIGPEGYVTVSALPWGDQSAGIRQYQYRDGQWQQDQSHPPVHDNVPGQASDEVDPIRLAIQGVYRDLDGDGQSEWLQQTPEHVAVFQFREGAWRELPFRIPDQWRLFPADLKQTESGLRFVDLNQDGYDDIVASDEQRFGAWLFESMETGWSHVLRKGSRGDEPTIPPIARQGTNNGAWFLRDTLWIQNEDTARLPDLVDRLTFASLLTDDDPFVTNKGLPLANTPQDALINFRVADGMRVDLVAAEPLIADPVAFDWGPDGRLWVAEMSDYPLGVDGKGTPGGRVRVLTDDDHDGVFDRSTIFLADLPFPTGVKVWKDSVIISTAPDVLMATDQDGDGKADDVRPIFRGFREGNQQHRVNGLRYGLDHRLYLANGDSGGQVVSVKTGQKMDIRGRDLWIDPDTGEMGTTSGQTQFGRNRDDWQHWFGGNNSNPMWHYVIEERYLARNPHAGYPAVRHPVSVQPGASPVYPLSQTLERFNDFQMANRFTSACSPIIYRDRRLGREYAGNAFICEPVHNLVHREVMSPSGATWTSQRAENEFRSEFLASNDSWFRPVMVRTGPDGALWIADMYRLVIEHPEWITPERQAQLDLRTGHDRGRIWRVLPKELRVGKTPSLQDLENHQLVAQLASNNGWIRDTAQQMLVWRDAREMVPQLRAMLGEHSEATARLHALATLIALHGATADDLAVALGDAHRGVRRWAARSCESMLDNEHLAAALVELAATETDEQVLLQVACSLGEGDSPILVQGLAKLMARCGDDPWIRAALASSIREDTVAALVEAVFVEATEPVATEMGEQLLDSAAAWMSTEDFGKVLARWLPPDLAQFSLAPEQTSWWLALMAWNRQSRDMPEVAQQWIDRQRPWALEQLDQSSSNLAKQQLAVALLGVGQRQSDEVLQRILDCLPAAAPTPLRDRALQVLAQLNDPQIASGMVQRWRQLSPSTRQRSVDLLLARPTWTESLVRALETGQIAVRELEPTAASRLRQVKNETLQPRISKLLDSVTISDRAELVAQYLQQMPVNGDAVRGKALFQQQCAACHRLAELGEQLGPDLAALTDKTTASLAVAILDPNRAIEDKYLQYVAETDDGLQLAGVILEESSSGVTLASSDGKTHTIRRSDLIDLVSTQQSLMPEGLEREIKPQQLADLVAFIREDTQPSKKFPGNDPQMIEADDLGVVSLAARHARIYGPQLVFEQQYENLGWWSDPKDHALWSFTVEQPGSYKVVLDYASAPGADGDGFAVIVAAHNIVGVVESTGSWDTYRDVTVGEVELQAGQHDLLVRSTGAIKSALIDLRTVKLVPVVK